MSFDGDISTYPYRSADDDDDWVIVSITDPSGAGRDGAFTEGLAGLGLPELVLWARPSEGEDPGADWLLTHQDRVDQLEYWAQDLIDGSLGPDDVQRRTFDYGFTTVTFRFGPPVTAMDAGVNGLPPGREVIVVAWSLTRRTAPVPPDPTSAPVRRVERWLSRSQALTVSWRQSGPGRAVPAIVGHVAARQGPADQIGQAGRDAQVRSAGQVGRAGQFGPMTRWVRARIDQLHAADEIVLSEFFDRIPLVALISCGHCIREGLLQLASRHGRAGGAREAINTAELILPSFTVDPSPPFSWPWPGEPVPAAGSAPGTEPIGSPAGPTAGSLAGSAAGPPGSAAWQRLVVEVGESVPPALYDEMRMMMEARLRTSLEDLLLAAVVADLAPADLMATACGSWEWAVNRGRLPGRAWLAPPDAREATRRLFTAPDGTSALLPVLDDPGHAGLLYDEADGASYSRRFDISLGSSFSEGFGHETVEELFRLAGPSSRHGTSAATMLPEDDRSWSVIGALQTVARGSARPGWLLTPRQRAGLSRREVRYAERLAAPLLTAVALPTHLHPDTWRLITAPLRPFIPLLPEEPPDGGLLL